MAAVPPKRPPIAGAPGANAPAAPAVPGGKKSPLDGVKQAWGKLSKPAQIMVALGLTIVFAGLLYYFMSYSPSKAPVPLFTDAKLNEQDLKDICRELDKMQIKYTASVSEKTILVPPEKKSSIRIQLAAMGLPKKIMEKKAPGAMDSPEVAKQKRVENTVVDVVNMLRQIDGISDARVTLVIPDEKVFKDDVKPATAAVMLIIQPDITLNTKQVDAIARLVAGSVPELKLENITITDSKSNPLYPFKTSDKTKGTGPDADDKISFQKAKEVDLGQKAQKLLDDTVGMNKAKVAVTLDLNWDVIQNKIQSWKDPGAMRSTKKKTEEYKGDKTDVSGTTDKTKGPKTQKDYKKVEEMINKELDSTATVTQKELGSIRRVSVALVCNDLPPEIVAQLKPIVARSVGLNDERGDRIDVANFKWGKSPNDALIDQLNSIKPKTVGFAPPVKEGGAFSLEANKLLIPVLAAFGVLMLLLLLYSMRQKKVAEERAALILEASGSSSISNITDLLADKGGKVTASKQVAKPTKQEDLVLEQTAIKTGPITAVVDKNKTAVGTSEYLSKIAKESPDKMASVLRTSWLKDD